MIIILCIVSYLCGMIGEWAIIRIVASIKKEHWAHKIITSEIDSGVFYNKVLNKFEKLPSWMKNEFYRLKNKKVYVDNKYAGKFMGFSYDYYDYYYRIRKGWHILFYSCAWNNLETEKK